MKATLEFNFDANDDIDDFRKMLNWQKYESTLICFQDYLDNLNIQEMPELREKMLYQQIHNTFHQTRKDFGITLT